MQGGAAQSLPLRTPQPGHIGSCQDHCSLPDSLYLQQPPTLPHSTARASWLGTPLPAPRSPHGQERRL